VIALHPYVPIGDSVRISLAILSYVDTVSFGVTADYSSADLNVFIEGIECGLAELKCSALSRSLTSVRVWPLTFLRIRFPSAA
jgi:hypothetical protein